MCKETLDSDNHGEVIVFFNRPMNLLKNTCFTIETETATTNNRNCAFVRQNKPGFGSASNSSTVAGFTTFGAGTSLFGGTSAAGFGTTFSAFGSPCVPTSGARAINSSPSEKIDKDDVVSCCSFGKCHLKCPDHSKYSGEIIQLLFKE